TYLYATVAHHQGSMAAHGRGTGPLLTARECQCLELAAQGKGDWDISQLLGISEHTVHKHVEAAKRRLGVSTRTQAIVWAVQHRAICFGDVVNSIETEGSAVPMNFPSRPTSLIRKPPMH